MNCVCVIAALIAAACSTEASSDVVFRADDASYILANGPNAIAGRAVMVGRNGQVYTCHLNGVTLYPVTDNSTRRMVELFGDATAGYASSVSLEHLREDQQFREMTRRAACDGDGRFQFENVADGTYYVQADILWVTHHIKSGEMRGGGALMQTVNVQGGERKEIVLERSFQ